MAVKRSVRFLIAVSVFLTSWFVASPPAPADMADELENLVGYTIVAAKTIEDEFEGCEYGRTVRFTDGSSLKCNTYGYSYSYRPTAVILARQLLRYKGQSLIFYKMIVGDDVYDMESVVSR